MSGNPSKIIHEKKIVRYYVCGESDTLQKDDRTLKKHFSAVRHSQDLTKKGFTNVEIYKNTKIYKTERLL